MLVLRALEWELRKLGRLLPPLRRSLVAPAAADRGFSLLADLLETLDPEQLRRLAKEEGVRLAKEKEKEEEEDRRPVPKPARGSAEAPNPRAAAVDGCGGSGGFLRFSTLLFGDPEVLGFTAPSPLLLPLLLLLLLLRGRKAGLEALGAELRNRWLRLLWRRYTRRLAGRTLLPAPILALYGWTDRRLPPLLRLPLGLPLGLLLQLLRPCLLLGFETTGLLLLYGAPPLRDCWLLQRWLNPLLPPEWFFVPLLTARWLRNLEEAGQRLLRWGGSATTATARDKLPRLQRGVGLWLLLAVTVGLQLLEGAGRWCGGGEEPPQPELPPENQPPAPPAPASPFIYGYDDAEVPAAFPQGGYFPVGFFGELRRWLQSPGALGELATALQLRWLRPGAELPEGTAPDNLHRCSTCSLGSRGSRGPTTGVLVPRSSAWKPKPRSNLRLWWENGGTSALFPHAVGQMRWLPPGQSRASTV